jgi:beta-glucosidase-like glycosyl hydrolase
MQWTVLRSLALAVLASAVHGAPNKASADLAIQAGYHVLYSYPGLTPPDHLFDLARAGKLGGIILFGENVNSSSDVKAIAKQFQDAYAQSPGSSSTKPPLLIVTDQEGGEVRRLAGGPVLSAKKVGASADPKQAATEAGTEAADALTAAGVNGNLAPVVDVYRVAGDFDDRYQRSFSNNASVVAECGAAWVIAQQNASLPATAKHFPGLGAASTYENTDDLPVNITLTLDELRRVDEAPYRSVIAAGLQGEQPLVDRTM